MARVLLRELRKNFDEIEAVKNLNLEVKDREFVCLLGPSGCGKTTTLRMIAGLEEPTSGEIYIGERLVNDLEPEERDVAMVFQFYALYPSLDVYGNLAFPLRAMKLPKKEIDKRVRETAERLGLLHILHKRARQLTSGEAQRVALGRAIIRRPQVYLLDEPLSNLDASLRVAMRGELKRMQKELAQTTIYVTHDQVEAMALADRIAVMSKGELQQYEPPAKIFNNPRNMFVAGFIGSPPMNFIECEILDRGVGMALRFNDNYIDVQDFSDLIRRNAQGNEVVLGVRPQDIHVDPKETGGDSFKAEVYVVEPLAEETILRLKLDGLIITASSTLNYNWKVGERVWIKLDRSKIHIFDRRTGNAIV